MRIDRSKREIYVVFALITIITFLLIVGFITFVINVNENKGIIPLIFLLLTIFYFLMFINTAFIRSISYENKNEATRLKFIFCIMSLVCLSLYALSFIVLWK